MDTQTLLNRIQELETRITKLEQAGFIFPMRLNELEKKSINNVMFRSGNATTNADGRVAVTVPGAVLGNIALNNRGYVSYLRSPDWLLYAAGTGYTVNDVLTLTDSGSAQIIVDAVDAGAITSYSTTAEGTRGISGIFSVTGGTGSGAKFYKNPGIEILISGDPSMEVNYIVFLTTDGAQVN